MATGTSSPKSPDSTPTNDSDALREFLEDKGKIETGLFGSALQALRNGLGWEQRMIEGKTGEQSSGADPMGDLQIGDNETHHHYPQPKRSTFDRLAPALLGASLLLGPAAGVLAGYLLRPDSSPPLTEAVDTDTAGWIEVEVENPTPGQP